MKHFLPILFIFSFNLVSPLLAQDKKCADMSALLENKIWKVQLPKDKQYAMEMEFRSAGWRTTFLYDEKQTKTFYPRLSNGASSNNWQSSTRTIYNGRLLRLADLELGYTFKKNWIAPIGMKSLRIYCLANNVALFAPWDMWDPETASFNGSKYPLPRKVNIGIRASF